MRERKLVSFLLFVLLSVVKCVLACGGGKITVISFYFALLASRWRHCATVLCMPARCVYRDEVWVQSVLLGFTRFKCRDVIVLKRFYGRVHVGNNAENILYENISFFHFFKS